MLFLRQDGGPLFGGRIADTVNDDNQEWYTTNARIARPVLEGTYTLAAMTKPSSGSRSFELTIAVSELIPHDYNLNRWAHQPDHTVRYELDESSIPAPISPNRPDLRDILPRTVERAAGIWNKYTSRFWPFTLICKSTDWVCDRQNHNNKNTDRRTVDIIVASGASLSKTGAGDDCGSSVACVKGAIGHLGSAKMIIEEPAWKYEDDDGREIHTRIIWTDDIRDVLRNRHIYKYLPGTVKHEFGHTLGLKDLYWKDYGGKYNGYVMGTFIFSNDIPSTDQGYLRQAYRNEHSSMSHEE